jgi:hypothetical protein
LIPPYEGSNPSSPAIVLSPPEARIRKMPASGVFVYERPAPRSVGGARPGSSTVGQATGRRRSQVIAWLAWFRTT